MSSILNQDERQTPMREIGLIGVPVKAGVILLAGFAAAVDAKGFAVPVTPAKGLTFLGRYEESVDKST